jgi:hypothetical protein
MLHQKDLKIVLTVLIVILTISAFVWLLFSLFFVGVPALILTVILIKSYSDTLGNVDKGVPVPQKLIDQNFGLGIALAIAAAITLYFVGGSSDSGMPYGKASTIIPSLLGFCFYLPLLYLLNRFTKRYNADPLA